MKPEHLFYIDQLGRTYTYADLIYSISSREYIPLICDKKNTFDIFCDILGSLVYTEELILLDPDFSDKEIADLGIDDKQLGLSLKVVPKNISDYNQLTEILRNSESWRLTMFTSGTTGLPKRVSHSFSSLVRMVRAGDKHKDDIWGFAYNPTHIAGIQVFFQALLNHNLLVDVFRLEKSEILKRLRDYRVSNISATPTFYRLLLPLVGSIPNVKRITSGGEKFDAKLSKMLQISFPNARMRNIYASTEAGSVLESLDDVFCIRDSQLARLQDGYLWLHQSLLGDGSATDEWYNTGDLVETVEGEKNRFRFISRGSDFVNVGGNKVNTVEVEQAINDHPCILQAVVYGKANPLLGSVLMADVVLSDDVSEKDLRIYLKNLLQDYKIPRMINIVKSIATTRSGKVKRNS